MWTNSLMRILTHGVIYFQAPRSTFKFDAMYPEPKVSKSCAVSHGSMRLAGTNERLPCTPNCIHLRDEWLKQRAPTDSDSRSCDGPLRWGEQSISTGQKFTRHAMPFVGEDLLTRPYDCFGIFTCLHRPFDSGNLVQCCPDSIHTPRCKKAQACEHVGLCSSAARSLCSSQIFSN